MSFYTIKYWMIWWLLCGIASLGYGQQSLPCPQRFDPLFQRQLPFTVHQAPEFPSGKSKLHQYILKHLAFTRKGQQQMITRVHIYFLVEADGHVHKLVVKGRDNLDLIKEGLIKPEAMLRHMPRWTPAKCHNKPVAFKVLVPINCIKYN
jgi:hypothetical protein